MRFPAAVMKNTFERLVAAFSIFFTMALPLLAGMVGQASHDLLVEGIANRTVVGLPSLSDFVFNNFSGLLWGMFGATVVLVVLGLWQWREEDATVRMGRLLLFAVASATLAVVFLALLVLATAAVWAVPQ